MISAEAGCGIMDVLSKDVLLIVYRYVFDSNYVELKLEYNIKLVPLWTDYYRCFAHGIRFITFRDLETQNAHLIDIISDIHTGYYMTTKQHHPIKIPLNYRYSNGSTYTSTCK